uniref:Lymphocyte cytosolic protein 2 n=1 Tax=Chelonoidis abingdonii TaxID=106734 RepID=A0A8C0IPZ8_CHEAB
MDLQNIPYRSVVVAWSPDDLADYFRKLKYKDCEKVVRKHSISGQRFLVSATIKFHIYNKIVTWLPLGLQLRTFLVFFVPLHSCLHIKFQIFKKEDDDYESPDEEQEQDADYESPTDEPGHDSDDYEPPPSNNDVAPHNVIFPAKSIPSNTEYIDTIQNKVVLLVLAQYFTQYLCLAPAPSIDRRTKPTLDRPGPPFERDSPATGQYLFMLSSFCTRKGIKARSLGEQLAKIQKPPIPPADKHERGNPVPGRKPPPLALLFLFTAIPQRSAPQLSLPPFNSNTFPSRSVKPPPKHSPSGSNSMSGSYAERFVALVIVSFILIYYLLKNESVYQCFSNWDCCLGRESPWQDGTFLVRNSSRKTNTHPYVLMVLYKDKVYNIQIRYQEQNQVYLLGTGLKGKEDFSSVADIIDYFQRMPLLLIDGKDRGSRNQCKLTYAAGST